MKPALLLIGLGNVGKAYEGTRHNVGFMAVEKLATGSWEDKQKFRAFISEGEVDSKPVLFVKPTTYMNDSGDCIRKLVDFYKLDPTKQILVVCDDIDLPLGEPRFRMHGGPGTHNGLKSIVEIFGEAFPRLRIGIGRQPEGMDLAAYVLSKMSSEETEIMGKAAEQVLPSASKLLTEA